MRMGSRGRWAVVVAAVLGTVGGFTTAFLAPGSADVSSTTFADPLDLGIPLQNLECTDQAIIVISHGDNQPAMIGDIVDNAGADAHYLRTSESCPTVYGSEVGPTPQYAAYLGPYDDLAVPCAERLTIAHRGDFVTRLRALNDVHVECACVLPVTTFPELTTGMDIDANVIWVRTLQGLLHDRDPDLFAKSAITGIYDAATVARVRAIQVAAPMTVTGVVGTRFWKYLRAKTCKTYDF